LQAAERKDGTQGRPLVSRVLAGRTDLLTPEVAIVLCRTGLPATVGPQPGQVTTEAGLSVVAADALSALVRGRTAGLDEEAARQEGLPQLVAAALADPHTPLAVQIPDTHILKAPGEGSQGPMLWGLRRIVWPLLGTTGRGWSFSTFEPPLGDVDPTTLPDILFRQAQGAPPAAPARPRKEIKVRPFDPEALDDRSLYAELAGWLVAEYRERGGDELAQLITEWRGAEQSYQSQLQRVYDELCARRSPVVVSGPPAPFVPVSPAYDPAREPGPKPVLDETAALGLVAADEFAPVDLGEPAPAEGRLPEEEVALLPQAPLLVGDQAGLAPQAPAPVGDQAGFAPEAPAPVGDQTGPAPHAPALGKEDVPGQQVPTPAVDLGPPATSPARQVAEPQAKALQAGTGKIAQAAAHDLAQHNEQDWLTRPDLFGEQHLDSARHGPHSSRPARPPEPGVSSGPATRQSSARRPAAVSDLLKKLPAARDSQEFQFILRDILNPSALPDSSERVKARREVSKHDWYGKIEQSGHVLSLPPLAGIIRMIIIPDLGNPDVIKKISDWAGDAPPVVIGALLEAAMQDDMDTGQLMMQVLQPILAYRWMIDNDLQSQWDRTLAPQPGSDPGRGRFSFWRKG